MIRPFGLRDVATVRLLQPRGIAFDLRTLLLASPSPTQSAIVAYLTRDHLGTITFVRPEEDGSPGGFAQARPRRQRPEWDLSFLAPSLDDHRDVSDMWLDLLSHLVILAAERDVARIYARCSEDSHVEGVLRSAGFSCVTREEIFVLAQPATPAPLPMGMMRAGDEDLDAILGLVSRAVPPSVQEAEEIAYRKVGGALTAGRGLYASQRFLWKEKGNIVAYLGLQNSQNAYWLDLIVAPGYRGDVLPYIRYALALVGCSSCRPVYCAVPDYCVGLGWILRTLHFASYARQAIYVAHTLARVRVRRPAIIPSLERGVESIPQTD